MSKTNTSLVFLNLTGNSGTANLNHALVKQELKLVHYQISFASAASESATAGSFLSIDLGGIFSQTRVNSNRSNFHDTLVVLNDVTSQVTNRSTDMTLHMDRQLRHSFKYNIYIEDGTLAANIESVNLIFEHSDGSII